MAFHSRRPSGPSASKQLPASCSARDQGADPAATTHSGSVSSSFASPSALNVPGATWIFQLWYRDHGTGGPTSNFSDAVAVTFE